MTVLPVIGRGKLWGVWPDSDMKGAQAFVDRKVAEGAQSGEFLIIPEQWKSPKPIGEFERPLRWGVLCISQGGKSYEVPRLEKCHSSYDDDGDDCYDEYVAFDDDAKYYLAAEVDELIAIYEMVLRRALAAPEAQDWKESAEALLE